MLEIYHDLLIQIQPYFGFALLEYVLAFSEKKINLEVQFESRIAVWNV